MCLIANELEQRGTPTLVLGAALDIMEAGRPPRGAFFDAPLGHTCGAPDAADQQRAILRGALAAFDAITEPGAIVHLPERWKAGDGWKNQASDSTGGDSRQPRDTTPQWQHPADAVAAEGAD
ncbi:MAG: hypothetical protein RIM84_08935 [Alphaproteobacteria bacterium]